MEIDQEKKEYEISFLLNLTGKETEIIEVLNKNQAEISNKGPIPEIKLAYPIKKQLAAFFGFYQIKALPLDIEKISADLKLISNILRFLIVKRLNRVAVNRPAFSPSSSRPKESPRPDISRREEITEVEITKSKSEALSNELLEKKLEEILK